MADQVEVRNDIVFGTGGGRELRCDVYTTATIGAGAPAVLLLHGGGWRRGSRSVMEGFGHRLAAAGYVGVASEYRLTPESPWPAQIHDVKAAIRWMRANADALGIDHQRIAILGRSAGAHLALLAAGTVGHAAFEGDGGNADTDTSLAAGVGIFPPTGFFAGESRTRGGTPARALLGEDATEDAAHDASPAAHVTATYPPTFLLHGTADTVVPPSASVVMYESLVAAGVPVELHMYAGQPHGFVARPEFIDLCAAEIAHFFGRFLTAEHEPQVDMATSR